MFIVAAALVVVASALYCSWPLGFWLNPVANRTGLASELGAWGQPYNWLFIWADIISGVLLVIACVMLAKLFHATGWRKLGLQMLALYGICGALDAAIPLRCLPSVQVCGSVLHDPIIILHGIVDVIGSAALVGTLVAEWVYAHKYHKGWLPWIYIVGGGGLVFAGLSLLFIIFAGPGFWTQRSYITLSCVWVASLPFIFHRQRRTSTSHDTTIS